MTEEQNESDDAKIGISLYEFYAIGIERLLERAPWELERAVSAYHESFLTEQRCLGLTILLLLGENQVPDQAIKAQAVPGFEDQTRATVNQAVFRRALTHYFQSKGLNPVRADMVLERMQSYLNDSREANDQGKNPLEAMLGTVVKRVPPQGDAQREQYTVRVEKIFDYIDGLITKGLLQRYEVLS